MQKHAGGEPNRAFIERIRAGCQRFLADRGIEAVPGELPVWRVDMPDTITIYQGPHERMARSRADLVELVKETVWHEIAHYFGLNEEEVLRAERRRARLRALGRGD